VSRQPPDPTEQALRLVGKIDQGANHKSLMEYSDFQPARLARSRDGRLLKVPEDLRRFTVISLAATIRCHIHQAAEAAVCRKILRCDLLFAERDEGQSLSLRL
jgi:hypothetical protein